MVAAVPYNGTDPTPYGNDTCLVACATSGCTSVPQVQLFDVLKDESVSYRVCRLSRRLKLHHRSRPDLLYNSIVTCCG